MIFSQPTTPPQVAVPGLSPQAAIVEGSPRVSPPLQLIVSSTNIGVPGTTAEPQPSPSPSISPRASLTSPDVPPSSSPSAPQSSPSSQQDASAQAQRRQFLEQKLLELVTQEKPEKEAQLRENLVSLVLKYARQGEIVKARQLAQDPVLPPEVQTALLREISEIQVRGLTLAPVQAKTTPQKPSLTATPPLANRTIAQNAVSSGQPGNYSVSPFYTPRYTGPIPKLLTQIKRGFSAFLFPLGIPAPITSLFGWRIHPIDGAPRFHQGIDIGAPIGTPVIAAHTGKVELADIVSGYGLTVILRHTDNLHSTLYGHLSQIFVQPGQVVKQGTVIALVGNTGNSTGPHLHFEMQRWTDQGWVALDPINEVGQSSDLAVQPASLPVGQMAVSLPRLPALPSVPSPTFSSGLPIVSTMASLPAANSNPLANTPFSGFIKPALTEDMGLIVPLALAAPISPALGWAVYPFISQLVEQSTPALAPVTTESMETVVVSANLTKPPSTVADFAAVSKSPSPSSLIAPIRPTRPQLQAMALRPMSSKAASNWVPNLQSMKLPALTDGEFEGL
ncbi:MAG: peptidoglycan DD-metalloendopeptidase family protein [Leptolyngbyaceae cyanobacterium]